MTDVVEAEVDVPVAGLDASGAGVISISFVAADDGDGLLSSKFPAATAATGEEAAAAAGGEDDDDLEAATAVSSLDFWTSRQHLEHIIPVAELP